jgi:outer membrane protein OmpA-like peptidoglycan-associated protein
MFRKSFVLMLAASALVACESSQAVTPPSTPAPPTAPASYMTFFDLGSTKLSDQSNTTIAQAAQVYKTKPNARITVTGYADTVGSPAMNVQLSQRRAAVVKDGLVKAGVPAAAITTSGDGETGLLVNTGDQANEPRNRRVAIVIN